MTFIDILTSQLFAMGFAGLTILYFTIQSILLYRKGKKAEGIIRSAAVPLMVLGLYAFLSGVYGQFVWPLPESYNILFYDVLTLAGLFFIATAWSLYKGLRLQHLGFLALLLGAMTIFYE